MSCNECKGDQGACAVLLAGGRPTIAQLQNAVAVRATTIGEMSVPAATMWQRAEGGAGVTANCMLGPPTETECTRLSRMLQESVNVYSVSRNKAQFGLVGTDGESLGYSPYVKQIVGSDLRLTLLVPTIKLSACHRISEISVEVTDTNDLFKYEGAAGLVSARSSWYAEEDGAVGAVSLAGPTRMGRKMLTTAGNSANVKVDGFAVYDTGMQVDFTIPGFFTVSATQTVTVRYEVERVFGAFIDCAFPGRCNEPDYNNPLNLPLA